MQRSNLRILEFAADVIQRSSREQPADACLREALRGAHGLTREESREASRLVFSYFRWLKWLKAPANLMVGCQEAAGLAELFRRDATRISDTDLVARSVPAWVGKETAITPSWVRALQTEPRLWIRTRPGQAAALRAKLAGCSALPGLGIPEALEYHGAADLFLTSEFQAGDFEIQDLHSQVVGIVCAPHSGEKWWDACAGEGGKTLHLADLMGNSGLIWASDRAGWRLDKLRRRAAKARVFNYRCAPWNGDERLPTKTSFDGVLVDAPCSGIGTWHRNPHARWTLRPEDVAELAGIQRRLLSCAAKAVKPGGKLVYAVCTLTRAETNEVADAFEGLNPAFRRAEIAGTLAGKVPSKGRIQLRTEDDGGNGMFIAVWQRD